MAPSGVTVLEGGPGTEPDYEKMRAVLVRAVARVCPGWLADRRDDIVQTALLKVVEIRRKAEESDPPPASYLWKVAYTATMDEIRRLRRRRETPLDGLPPEAEQAGPAADPQRRREQGELAEAVNGELRALSEPRQAAVLLHLYGFSLEESARMLGWTTKRVDNQRYQGLAALRKGLLAKGIGS